MPAKNPRLNIVVEEPVYRSVQRLAEKEGVSVPTKVGDLLKEALEMQEDIHLSAVADERARRCDDAEAFSHEDVWS